MRKRDRAKVVERMATWAATPDAESAARLNTALFVVGELDQSSFGSVNGARKAWIGMIRSDLEKRCLVSQHCMLV